MAMTSEYKKYLSEISDKSDAKITGSQMETLLSIERDGESVLNENNAIDVCHFLSKNPGGIDVGIKIISRIVLGGGLIPWDLPSLIIYKERLDKKILVSSYIPDGTIEGTPCERCQYTLYSSNTRYLRSFDEGGIVTYYCGKCALPSGDIS